MDFASALQRLEKTADQAANQQQRDGSNNGNSNTGHCNNNYQGSGRGGRGGSYEGRHSYHSDHHGNNYRGGGGRGGRFSGRRRAREDYAPRGSGRDYQHDGYDRHRPRPRFDSQDSRGGNDRPFAGRGGRGGRRPLEEMIRCGYRGVDPGFRPIQEIPADLGHRPFHIALLAICIDGLPFEHIWQQWAQQTFPEGHPGCYVSLLVHAKYPHQVQSETLQRHIITKPPRMGRGNSYADPEFLTHTPAWGSIEITRAMIDLLKQAHRIGSTTDLAEQDVRFQSKRFWMSTATPAPTKIPPVDKFLFVSETCLPVQTLPEMVEAFFGDYKVYQQHAPDYRPPEAADSKPPMVPKVDPAKTLPWEVSWVNARNRNTEGTPRNKYESDQFANIHRMVHGAYRWKADQWLALSRVHATAVLGIDGGSKSSHHHGPEPLWKAAFVNTKAPVQASDEMYFPCCLAVTQILVEHSTHDNYAQVRKQAITFTDWSEGMRNPMSYYQGPADLTTIATRARLQGSLVARKFVLQRSEEDAVTGEMSWEDWQVCVDQARDRAEQEAARLERERLEKEAAEKERLAKEAAEKEREASERASKDNEEVTTGQDETKADSNTEPAEETETPTASEDKGVGDDAQSSDNTSQVEANAEG